MVKRSWISGGMKMPGKGPSTKEMAQLINNVMGHNVLTEQQLKQILQGAKRVHERGGMPAVLDYLMKVTQVDVDRGELEQFADNIQKNPQMGMDILQGKRKTPRKKR
ncbi:30S ribosomal protein S7 [Desmospora sp. 8437]|nr:30S ribosomal protein S7 [Desmospora sp. 8437]